MSIAHLYYYLWSNFPNNSRGMLHFRLFDTAEILLLHWWYVLGAIDAC